MGGALQHLVGFFLGCVELLAQVSKGFSFELVSKFISLAREAGPALAQAPEAFEEYKNMSDEQAIFLETWIVNDFDIPNDDVEKVIEKSLKVAIELHGLVKLVFGEKKDA